MRKKSNKRGQRGKYLESFVNKVNMKYRREKLAMIRRIDVPIRMTNFGYQRTLSTVDFEGVVKKNNVGIAVAFDAKQTTSKTSFPLSNIHQHQLDYLLLVEELCGIAFFLIMFTEVDDQKAYKVSPKVVKKYWDAWKDNKGRASIPISKLKKEWLVPVTDYLTIL